MNDQRYLTLRQWLKSLPRVELESITPITGDASFRRYFRLRYGEGTAIAVDAPPAHENCHAFVAIASAFSQHGLLVPTLYHYDLTQGFMLISDLGDQLLLHACQQKGSLSLYQKAIDQLLILQSCRHFPNYPLPEFSQSLLKQECELFKVWYLEKFMQVSLTTEQVHQFEDCTEQLIEMAHAQPQLCTHRDYHSRNLMVLDDNQLGIIDFQDAVMGPISYDLVSLLRDCYVHWPVEQVTQLTRYYFAQAKAHHLLNKVSFDQFVRWFDWTGIQRHLKAVGIFARLYQRDQKAQYLNDIPRTLQYITASCARYPELASLGALCSTLAPKEH